jgi:type II secretory pathway pseudopilin PulG
MYSFRAPDAAGVKGRGLDRRARERIGFTLVEALVSMSITATAGAALLLGIASALQTTEAVIDQTLALGLAEQLMDEMALLPYCEPGAGAFQTALGPEAGESTTINRLLYDDLDDYHGLVEQPPRDRWGVPLGADDGRGGQRHPGFQPSSGSLANYRREVQIHYVSETDPTIRLASGQTSGYRSVHVRVWLAAGEQTTLLVDMNRVFAYVPTP